MGHFRWDALGVCLIVVWWEELTVKGPDAFQNIQAVGQKHYQPHLECVRIISWFVTLEVFFFICLCCVCIPSVLSSPLESIGRLYFVLNSLFGVVPSLWEDKQLFIQHMPASSSCHSIITSYEHYKIGCMHDFITVTSRHHDQIMQRDRFSSFKPSWTCYQMLIKCCLSACSADMT